ncbi:MAG: hypothetical protein DRO88_04565 [Promethearchaeia archaeon]|nr:MAG: hypothetical protein DRO88_04565 [Candidatus Lokiarchaeia archaeon]
MRRGRNFVFTQKLSKLRIRKFIGLFIGLVLISSAIIGLFGTIPILFRPKSSTKEQSSIQSASSPVSASDLIASVATSEDVWSVEDYDMIFVIPPDHPEFKPVAEEFAAWKAELGYHVLILDNYTSYLGRDNAEKLRNALISYYNRFNLQWLLIMGDTELIPIRYIYNPDGVIVDDHEAVGSAYLKPTDFYYADLTGDWNIDGDSNWGEDGKYNSLNGEPEVDYYPELYVGRFPVDNVVELEQMMEKTMHYEKALTTGDWMHRYLAISGISDPASQFSDDKDGEDEAILNQYILDNFVQDQMEWRHLEEHTSAYIPPDDPRIEPLTKSGVIDAINQGQAIIVYAGHGSPTSFFSANALSTTDIPSLTNFNKTAFLYADACSTNAFDVDSPQSLGESFVKANNSGGIGYVGSMRISWYYPNDTALEQDNRGLLKLFMQQMFEKGMFQQGKALYESKIAYVESDWFQLVNKTEDFNYFEMERKSLFSYMLLGDPSVDIYTNTPHNFISLSTPGLVKSPYQGASSIIKLQDTNGIPIPYGRIVIEDPEGRTKTFVADENGTVTVIFPKNASWVSYSLIGHNMQKLFGNITLEIDSQPPNIAYPLQYNPNQIVFGESVSFSIGVLDAESGVEKVWLLSSKDNFTTSSWQIYQMKPRYENSSEYCVSIIFENLTTFNLVTVIQDRVGNWIATYPNEVLTITVETPPIVFILICLAGFGVVIPVAVAIFSLLYFRNHRKQKITSSKGNLFII